MIDNQRLHELFKEHVPATGQAETIRGELVRAVMRIGYRFYNDGDQIGRGYGNHTCNAAGRYIQRYGNYKMREKLDQMWDGSILPYDYVMTDDKYEEYLEELIDATVDYLDGEDPALNEKTPDMFSFSKDEDEDYEYDEEEDEWM